MHLKGNREQNEMRRKIQDRIFHLIYASHFLKFRPISSTELSYTPVEDDRPGSAHCGHCSHCSHALSQHSHAPLAPPPLHCCPATRRAFTVNMNLAQEVKLILRELR